MGLFDFFKNNDKNKTIPIIDVSDDMNLIINNLAKNYQDYCNYDEILQIKENERLKLLKYVWEKWAIHISSINNSIIEDFPNYDKDVLLFIARKESKRISVLFRSYDWGKITTPKSGFEGKFINYYPFMNDDKTILKLCFAVDMPKLFKVWKENDKINFTEFRICGEDYAGLTKDVKQIYMFKDNHEKELTIDKLKEICNQYQYEYPLYVEPEIRKQNIKNKQLEQLKLGYEKGILTREKYLELVSKINTTK